MIHCNIHTHTLPDNRNYPDIIILNRMISGDEVTPCIDPDNYYSIGIHPWYIVDPEEEWRILEEKSKDPLVVAIGEAGLDKLAKSSMNMQEDVFRKQALLAEELGKPLIIHCVKAWSELLHIYKVTQPDTPWLIHGFRGNGELAQQLLKAGMKLSFGYYFNPAALEVAWPDALFTETDDRTDSIAVIYDRIATSLQISSTDLAIQVRKNVASVFSI